MVEFLRDRPEYAGHEAKYIFYVPLFKDIVDQSDIRTFSPDGWAAGNMPDNPEPAPPREEFRLHYLVDDSEVLSIKDVTLTVGDNRYSLFDDPDTIRLASIPAFYTDTDYPKNENGSPDIEHMPTYHVVAVMFDSFPADSLPYRLEVIGDSDEVVLAEEGTINITDPVVEES